jgi:hypothetical protein
LGQPLSDVHIPTGRVSFEDVVVFSSTISMRAPRDDWREIITETRERFEAFRTWA